MRDAGSIHVLDATIGSLIIVGAIAFMVTLDAPQFASSIVANEYRDALHNFIEVMDDLPPAPNPCSGTTLLEQQVIRGVSGNEADWKTRVASRLGPHTLVDLTLDNGPHQMPITTPFERAGIAGVRTSFRPNWTYLMSVPASDAANGAENLVTDTLAVHRASLVKPLGEPVMTTLTVDGALRDPSVSVTGLTGLPSSLIESDATRAFAQNVTWMQNLQMPGLTRTMLADHLRPEALPPFFQLRITPALRDSHPPASIPDTLRAAIEIPGDWTIEHEETNESNPGWAFSTTGSDREGWSLLFDVVEEKTEPQILTIFARPPAEPARPFDFLHARLSRGSLGTSTLAVTYPVTADKSLPLEAYATTPYPVRAGTRAIFGTVFANGGDAVTVKQVDIEIPGGYDTAGLRPPNGGHGSEMFAQADLLVPDTSEEGWSASGEWTWISGRHLQWKGTRAVEAGKAASWLVSVLITDDPTKGTSTEPQTSDGVVSTLTFPNGYNHTSTHWGDTPGIIRHQVPPESLAGGDGYPWRLIPPGTEVSFGVRVEGDGKTVSGNGTYRVEPLAGDVVKTQRAIANSSFHILDRTVPLGSIAVASADIESLTKELSTLGVTGMTFTTELFAPASVGCTPAASWTSPIETTPSAGIVAARMWDPLGGSLSHIFLTSTDNKAYRLDQTGRTLWSRDVAGDGTHMATARFSAIDTGLFIGNEFGAVHRIDPLTGQIIWTRTPANTTRVMGLAVDEATNRVAVTSMPGPITIYDGAGTQLAATPLSADSATNAAFTPTGDLLVLRASRLERWDTDLTLQAISPANLGLRGFAQTPVGILAGGSSTRVLDPMTLEIDPAYAAVQHGSVELTTQGDATGDGVPDLVLALKGPTVFVVDGTTGTAAWSRTVTGLPPGADTKFVRPIVQEQLRCKWIQNPFGSYGDTSYACLPDRPTTSQAFGIVARDGHVALAAQREGIHELTYHAPTGLRWRQFLGDDEVATAVDAGPWLTQDGILLATVTGLVNIHDTSDGVARFTTTPTSFAGRFYIQAALPHGGFYGPHVLRATLSWTDTAGIPQQARFSEWFEGTRQDDSPAGPPAYTLIARLEDRSDPMVVRARGP